jgi:hypothetical protein
MLGVRAKAALLGVLVVGLLATALATAPVARAADCRFVLGFAALHNLIPGIIGDCLNNEQHNPANGDALQHTTGGLLVWRKLDNFTAFTDGYRTWVNGPRGLEERLNGQRFAWEANPAGLPVVPAAPISFGRCHTNELSISQNDGQVAVGNVGVTFQLRSIAAQPCTLYGFPGLQLLDAAAQPLPTYLTWSRSGYLIGTVPERTLTLLPGDRVYFVLQFSDVPRPGDRCVAASNLRITPPNAFTSAVGQVHGIAPCGGRVTVSPVLAIDPLLPGDR